MATADLGGESLACTTEFHRVDTGLLASEEPDSPAVFSELFTVSAQSVAETAQALAVAAGSVAASAEALRGASTRPSTVISAQPGQLFRNLALPPAITTRHALLAEPHVWQEGVPRYVEPGRLTVMLQLLLLTDDELNYAVTYGVGALQQALVDEGVNLLDWRR